MKNPFGKKHSSETNRMPRKGFALVVTLSLMILLTVVAVGLLSLASISLRSSSQSSDMSMARSNARMSLMLALGDLQKTAGRDTRVTARADLLDENNPPVLGVWKSWEGTDHEVNGRPSAPDYSDHKSSKFVAWLTSAPSNTLITAIPNTKPPTGTNDPKVALLGEKSVGTTDPTKRQIYLAPNSVTLDKLRGGFAWWVSGENQKARLPRPYAPTTDNAATWSVIAKTHASADTASFGLNALLKDPSLTSPALVSPSSKTLSIKQGDLLGAVMSGTNTFSKEYYHDISTNSMGLLTNVSTGGWRKDLSLATENWEALATSNLPFFRVAPDRDLLFTRATESDPLVAKSILYNWADYRRGAAGLVPIYSFPAISSWTNLAKYATLYKDITAVSAASAMSVKAQAEVTNGNVYNYIHKVRVMPVIARVQWIFSHRSEKINTPPALSGKYDLYLVVTPVITLWNPYNVKITELTALNFSLQGSLPPLIEYTVGDVKFPKKISLQTDRMAPSTAAIATGLTGITNYSLSGMLPFAPGETRVFTPDKSSPNTLIPGYFPGNGLSFKIQPGSATTSGGGGKISTTVSFDSEYIDAGATGVGLYMDMGFSKDERVLAYRMSYQKNVAVSAYPPLAADKMPSPTLEEVATAVPTPFLSVTFGARMASNTHLPSKGFVQSSPFVNYTAMGQKSAVEPTISYTYPGTQQNVNSPFEYSFQGLLANSPFLPEADPVTKRGYILTGFKSGTGLSRCIIAELPGRPLNSLAELQNWDARYENPIPPYAFNLVGNSDATPLLPSNAVVNLNEKNAKGAENLQNDDSYCLNHALFDDWFFSSITPEPTAFGKPSASSLLKVTYANLLRDPTKPLANRAYKALQADVNIASISVAKANALATTNVGNTATSWKTIASRLEVEGMFNVNSTSVKAWRALLGHARDQKIPYIGASGNTELSGESQYPVSRFSVAGDVESKKAGASGILTTSAEYAGYRVYSESQLDFLAQEIVNQVRLRGPFLSLSEFVNRQLSNDKNLAIAGAVQTALNKLTENASQNPFTVLQKDTTPGGGSNQASMNPPGGATDYKFPEAAVGYNIYGIPGWTRQADILRPLAPILSARDDTFTIRAYGDARERMPDGKIVIKARTVCEATIRRTREFVDPADDAANATLTTKSDGTILPLKAVNQAFGRRFEIVTFRWLSPDEI